MTVSFLERRSGRDRRENAIISRKHGSFTDIYELILNNSDLVASELLELEKLLHRKMNTLADLEDRAKSKTMPSMGVNQNVR